MMLVAVAAGVFVTWKLVRFVDELTELRVARQLQRLAVFGLASACLVFPTAFTSGTARFIEFHVQSETERLMKVIQPIVDQLSELGTPSDD